MEMESVCEEIDSFDVVHYNKLNEENINLEQLANTELQHRKKNEIASLSTRISSGWSKEQRLVFVLTCISIYVLTLQICAIVSLLLRNKYVPTARDDGSILANVTDIADSICLPITNEKNLTSDDRLIIQLTTDDILSCVKGHRSIQSFVNVVLVVHLKRSDDKRKEVANVSTTFKGDSNDDDSLIYFEAYLDTRNLQQDKEEKNLGPWIVNNGISGVEYGRQNRSFVIQKQGLYFIHTSINFKYSKSNIKALTGEVYRKDHDEANNQLIMNTTVSVTANGNNTVYLSVELREQFTLHYLDEIFVRVSDVEDILPYVVSNVLGIYKVC